jgi:hypothetical protein
MRKVLAKAKAMVTSPTMIPVMMTVDIAGLTALLLLTQLHFLNILNINLSKVD